MSPTQSFVDKMNLTLFGLLILIHFSALCLSFMEF